MSIADPGKRQLCGSMRTSPSFDAKTSGMRAVHSPASNVRARLRHPVIDSDGHWIEFEALALDYLKQVGGPELVRRYQGSASQFFSNRFWAGLPEQEREPPQGNAAAMVDFSNSQHPGPRHRNAAPAAP